MCTYIMYCTENKYQFNLNDNDIVPESRVGLFAYGNLLVVSSSHKWDLSLAHSLYACLINILIEVSMFEILI
jgi:hypothetical protein